MTKEYHWSEESMTDKEIKGLLNSLVLIPNYQKKQIAMLLIADTLTTKSAKETFKLIQ